MMTSAVATPAQTAPKNPVVSIAGQVAKLSTGDRAQLRRIYLTRRHSADGIVIGVLHRAKVELPSSEAPEVLAPWRLLAHVAAVLSGTAAVNPHSGEVPLGAALHAADFTENRLLRLTTSRGPLLYDQIVHAARMLAQKGKVPVDLKPFLDLARGFADRAEPARIRIAQDYYAAVARSKGDAK